MDLSHPQMTWSCPADVDRMQREVGKEKVWPLEGVAISAKKIICKGRKELIEILGRNILHVLYSRYIITRKEYWDFPEAEEDSKEKSKKLLHMIQERGEQACCRFLECVEMEHPGSIQNVLLAIHAEDHSRVYIAHFVKGEMKLEKPDRVEPHHAVLENPKFSSLGIVFKKWFKQKINTVARLYQILRFNMPIFHLYLLPNDPSLIKAVDEHEAKHHYQRIVKPPGTLKSLKIGTQVFVQTLDNVTICPEEVKFQYLSAEKEQHFVELSAGQMQEKFSFTLVEKRTNELIWKAHVNQGDCGSSLPHTPSQRKVEKIPSKPATEKTIADCLMSTLENLEEDELKRFKLKLHEFPLREGYDNIPLGKLEKADVVDLCQRLLSSYMEDYAVQVTAKVLRAINCRNEAQKLLALTGKE
ncbi:uncharacterized protein LOC118078987 isoform X3 [Zootoca vivipara]|uniref:uncharacterized protein LOC118078987 isoform X3 n=1 Tax=Zootoca vivipara TaxID=8524 RepID=UPI00293BA661|nr:uncharacterized protein LOC118078987 isoform X3 [Zootoca vivipara]